jgi:hypothetical protein
MGLKGLIGVMVLSVASFSAASIVAAPVVSAQEARPQLKTVPQAFSEAYFRNGRDFYRDRSIGGQFNLIFGPGALVRNSFTENVMSRDLEAIDRVFLETFARQVSSDPVIRTPDLPNPFNTSVLTLPASVSSVPSAEPTITQPFRPPLPEPAPQSAPVPALW